MSKRRITIADLKQMKWVSDPRVSPNGKQIAYVIKEVDPKDNSKYVSRVWVVNTEGGQALELTSGPRADTNPRWSPDSKTLAFSSNRNEGNQIWLLPMDGGEAKQLTKGKVGAGAAIWSPDGTKIAFLAKVNADGRNPADNPNKSDVRVITRLHYKQNGEGFLEDRYAQIFVVDVVTGEERQVTSGEFDCGQPSWSPCGGFLTFSSNRAEDAEYHNLSDIWVLSLESGNLTCLTKGEGPCSSPSWSPDGKHIAYLGHMNEYKSATLPRIMVISPEGGKPQVLTASFDRSPGNAAGGDMVSSPDPGLVWAGDSSSIFFLATDGPRTNVYSVCICTSPQVEQISSVGDRVVYGMSHCTATGDFVLAITSPTEIGNLYRQGNDRDALRLTDHNDRLLAEIAISEPELFNCESDGIEVEGWVIKPVGYSDGKKYPAILEIHGGPHVAYGHAFMHEFQLLAAAGYVVIYTNPPGSQGYGQEFVAKTHHDWGGADYRAVMAAVEYVSKFDYIDTERLGITGGSYGGYMTNWVIGHDQRFKAAVTQRSTCNRYSQFGTSDVGFFNGEFEFMGNPWDNPQFYLERSPITYVQNVETPLLLIHSEQDLRCPMEQAEQFYTALKWLKKEAVLVRFPNENHELSRSGQPNHRAERLEHIVNWFKKYIPTNAVDYAL